MMHDDLYFIPILARALSGVEKEEVLEDTFRTIRQLGTEARYRRGWDQFMLFMNVVADAAAGITGDSDVGDRTAMAWPVDVIVEREEKVVRHLSLPAWPEFASVCVDRPGYYCLRLSTGRTLWEGELSERDLFWSRAFPGQALDLAAGTGPREQRTSREVDLLGGEVVLRVCPGLETGCIEISVRPGGSQP